MTALRVLMVGTSIDGDDVGESRVAHRWAEAISRRVTLTVLATAREDRVPLAEQLPHARVVTWPEKRFLYQNPRLERLNAMAKLNWPFFVPRARRWIRAALARGERFDIGHQILPMAMRHVTPLRGWDFPYVMGPLGGGLETPAAFRREVARESLPASRLRVFDAWRRRRDPRLRATYADADLVIGVAPYVADLLRESGVRRFFPLLELGRETAPPPRERHGEPGRLLIAHVGRAVRTKGLRDVIRAMAHLDDLPGVTLVSAGGGSDLAACRAEAARLGVGGRVTFLGQVPREEVESVYENADVFCFPSFREPTGGVLLEAMAHGLPIITAAAGGPDFIVDDASGIRVPVTDPEQFPRDIAAAIRVLALDPERRLAFGRGARARLNSFGTWDDKAETVVRLYHEVIAAARERAGGHDA